MAGGRRKGHGLWTVVFAASLVAGCAAGVADASRAPDLRTLESEPVTLEAVLEGHRGAVLVWWSTRCPCVARYHDRVEALKQRWEPRGVAVLAVSSNSDDDVARLKRVAGERGLTVPLVVDEGGRLAQRLGVHSTPTVVVLDGAGEVRFRGWIDNERVPGEDGREAWVDEAVAAMLDGGDAQARTPTWGCAITRSLSEVGRCKAPPAH